MVDKPCVNPALFWNWVYYLCAQNVKHVTQFFKTKNIQILVNAIGRRINIEIISLCMNNLDLI